MTITLVPGCVTLPQLMSIYWNGEAAALDRAADENIERGAARIAEIARGNAPVYGINTGFGKLASIKIDSADVATLQRNLILSHCCGIGAPLPENVVRLIMALKLVSLGRGASGVRLELVRLIEAMLEKGVTPV
ncbi:MAG: histidine ammonia-lyase, partial [Stutzerimonas stutzeri]